MRKLLSVIIGITFCMIGNAQSTASTNYTNARLAPAMRWTCPEIDKYQTLLSSLRNEDYKIYADNVKEKIELVTFKESPSEKYQVTQAILNIENPLFETENLLSHISTWIRSKYKDWGKNIKTDKEKGFLVSTASINIANHSRFMHLNKVYISPTLIIQMAENNKLAVSFSNLIYKNNEYIGSDRKPTTYTAKVSEVYPFKSKGEYKITYAKAYVSTYQYYWNFITDLCEELNTNFTKDPKLLAKLQYEYSKDSLRIKYGEPTKVIADQASTPDVNKELHFYESAQKLVFMGKTIDFRDIISCEIVDDPQYIPGRSTTLGAGICIFGFGLGGAETVRTPDKTIHNYVVNVKIDNLGTPLIRIGTGQNEYKATEISSAFEYILRHQTNNNGTGGQKIKNITRKARR